MKIKQLFLSGLVALGAMACSDKDEMIDTGGKNDLNTYLTLQITNPESDRLTRTEGSSTEVGTGAENTVGSIQVYLTDTDGVIISATSPSITSNKTEAFQVPVGTHEVYVMVNSPLALAAAGESVFKVIENVTEAQAKTGFNGGSFMMASAAHHYSNKGGTPVTISAANTQANPAKLTVAVDRAAAKIVSQTATGALTVGAELMTKYPKITSLNLQGFALVNGNRSFNVVQQWANWTDANVKGNVASTPAPQLVGGYYDMYNNIASFGAINTDGYPEDLTLGMTPNPFAGTPIYTIENRPAFLYTTQAPIKLTSGMGVTTAVVYRVVANGVVDPENPIDDNTFFVYKGVVYQSDEFNTLKALNDFKNDDGTSKIEGLNVSARYPELRSYGVKVYENGNIYYTYFIQDQNYTVDEVTAGTIGTGVKYNAVLRNSVYNLTINRISDLGDDIPGGGAVTPEDPNPPIVSDNAYLDVSVKVNPWVLNNIGIEW